MTRLETLRRLALQLQDHAATACSEGYAAMMAEAARALEAEASRRANHLQNFSRPSSAE